MIIRDFSSPAWLTCPVCGLESDTVPQNQSHLSGHGINEPSKLASILHDILCSTCAELKTIPGHETARLQPNTLLRHGPMQVQAWEYFAEETIQFCRRQGLNLAAFIIHEAVIRPPTDDLVDAESTRLEDDDQGLEITDTGLDHLIQSIGDAIPGRFRIRSRLKHCAKYCYRQLMMRLFP